MNRQCEVQLNLELGHIAQLREKETPEDFTHDWTAFVRGPQTGDLQHLVEKVVFHLHDSYPNPKRIFREPPYEVNGSGSENFLMHIEFFLKNKEKPKKVCFKYNLFLKPEGDHLRCETLTFNTPSKEFRRKLVKAGGVLVAEGAEAATRSGPDVPPSPPTKKIKTSHVSEMKTVLLCIQICSHVSNPAKTEVMAVAKLHKSTKTLHEQL
ncbi:protein ENL-like isoform X2 [Centropristis striata]|uniref:protein ENL-like isoform X2 n=1 Tax=Centropristis striata TaxID=184440 RepID=UPI0027E2105A|nr:protein ENL-like isoform X2 [Centropristis striata]